MPKMYQLSHFQITDQNHFLDIFHLGEKLKNSTVVGSPSQEMKMINNRQRFLKLVTRGYWQDFQGRENMLLEDHLKQCNWPFQFLSDPLMRKGTEQKVHQGKKVWLGGLVQVGG